MIDPIVIKGAKILKQKMKEVPKNLGQPRSIREDVEFSGGGFQPGNTVTAVAFPGNSALLSLGSQAEHTLMG